jgi:hypothetical protein
VAADTPGTVAVAIPRPWRDVYEAAWRPEAFAHWASGLAAGNLRREAGVWHADGPEGPITIRFTPHNEFGVMDHLVDAGTGADIYMPLRIVADGNGALALLTVFRQPNMTDETYARDLAWVKRDLEALRDWIAGA